LTRGLLRWAGAAWIALLTGFSLQPWRWKATSGPTPTHLGLHALVFGIAALSPILLSRTRLNGWLRALGVVALAAAIELAQAVLYRHRMEWHDLQADALGVLLAAYFALSMFANSRYAPGTPAGSSRNHTQAEKI